MDGWSDDLLLWKPLVTKGFWRSIAVCHWAWIE
jgi:hypothetical protein